MGFVGADLFFSAMDIMDRSVSLLNTGDETRQGGEPGKNGLVQRHRRSPPRVLKSEVQ